MGKLFCITCSYFPELATIALNEAQSCKVTHALTQTHYSPISYDIDVLPCCLAFEWFNTLYCKVHLLSDSFCQGGFLNTLLMIPPSPPRLCQGAVGLMPSCLFTLFKQHLWCCIKHPRWHIEPGAERWRETVNAEHKGVEREKNGASEDEKGLTSVSLRSSDEGGMWRMKGSASVVLVGGVLIMMEVIRPSPGVLCAKMAEVTSSLFSSRGFWHHVWQGIHLCRSGWLPLWLSQWFSLDCLLYIMAFQWRKCSQNLQSKGFLQVPLDEFVLF